MKSASNKLDCWKPSKAEKGGGNTHKGIEAMKKTEDVFKPITSTAPCSPWFEKELSKRDWLEQAYEFEPLLVSTFPSIDDFSDYVLEEISDIQEIGKRPRARYALKQILLNLYVGHQAGVPIYYSRNRNNYTHPRRYDLLFFKYDRMTRLIDALEKMDFIEQYIGLRNQKNGHGRMTRMYPKNDLGNVFDKISEGNENIVKKSPKHELIELKNSEKERIDYIDNDFTNNSRNNLILYNEYISENNVVYNLNEDTPVSIASLETLIHRLLNGEASLIQVEVTSNEEKISDTSCNNNIKTIVDIILSMTKIFLETEFEPSIEKIKSKNLLLKDFGISNISFSINYKNLHRVFNQSSFDLGGRFYGATYQNLKKEWRKYLCINNEPVIEPDYSSLHIRMLYHLENINYRDNPYEILCNDIEEKKLFKIVQLVSINAKNESMAIHGIKNKFISSGITDKHTLLDTTILEYLNRFKEGHKRIMKYIHSGKGIELQNMDSEITNNILMRLIKKDICSLPVHDSYICERRHEGLLKEAMEEEYEKVMGFKPIIA